MTQVSIGLERIWNVLVIVNHQQFVGCIFKVLEFFLGKQDCLSIKHYAT